MRSFDMQSPSTETNKEALVLLGTFTYDEGMYEYYMAWQNQLLSQGIEISNTSSGLDCAILRCVKENLRFGYGLHLFLFLVRVSATTSTLRDFANQIADENVKRIRVLDDFVYSSIYLFLLSLFFKGPIYITIHDPQPHPGHTSGFAKLVYDSNRLLIRKICRHRPNVYLHFHSEKLRKSAPVFSNLKYVVFPHPIPRPRFVFDGTKSIEFLLVGRLKPYKGIDIFLEAAALLQKRRPELFNSCKFVLAGRGNIDVYEDYGLPKLPNFSVMNEFLSAHELHALIATSQYLVLPYTSGTASGVGVLATSYSVPVLVSNVGDLPDLVQYNEKSLLLSENNPESLFSVLMTKSEELFKLKT